MFHRADIGRMDQFLEKCIVLDGGFRETGIAQMIISGIRVFPTTPSSNSHDQK